MVKKIQNTALVHENKIISENVKKKLNVPKKLHFIFFFMDKGGHFFLNIL